MFRRRAWLCWLGVGLFGFSLLAGARLLVAQAQKPRETPAQMAEELARVVDRLNALALQFDLDKNRVLAPQEQEQMLKAVAENHGVQWAERVKWFLKGADTNGDESIDEEQWTAAIKRLQQGREFPPARKESSAPRTTRKPTWSP
jgi:hypothetical protein